MTHLTMKFKVGDVCVTQGSRAPLLNNGHVVVVIAIDPGTKSYGGDCTPYRIRRIDGQRFGLTSDAGGHSHFYLCDEAWCRERQLRRYDEPAPAAARRRRSKTAVAA